MANPTPTLEAPSKHDAWRMFDRIAGRYDQLNRMLSFGQDLLWRSAVAKCLPKKDGQRILDIATGTADQLISIFKRHGNSHRAIGLDMSGEMLAIGRNKIQKRTLDQQITLVHGNALNIPIANDSIDAVTITFGIRNLVDINQGLREMNRILKSGGYAIILEFSMPENRFFRQLYLFYLRNLLPRIGGLISGDRYAYTYLNKTVETFPYGEKFCSIMRQEGFSQIKTIQLNLGIATIYRGQKN